jgi:DedD protein
MPDSREPQLDELRRRARRRLVGAVVLALAAAVLVPMLLESDPKPLGEDVSVKIPPIDDGKFVSKVGEKGAPAEPTPAVPKVESKAPPKSEVAAQTAPDAAAAPKDAPAIPAEAPKETAKALASAEQRVLAPPQKAAPGPVPAKAATVPPGKETSSAPVAKAETAVKPEAAAKPADADKAGTFAVQLAAFIDDKGANSLAGKLKKAGYPAYTEPYETTRGTLWRVRVGPYPSRDAAEGVRVKLKGEGQNGIITAAK